MAAVVEQQPKDAFTNNKPQKKGEWEQSHCYRRIHCRKYLYQNNGCWVLGAGDAGCVVKSVVGVLQVAGRLLGSFFSSPVPLRRIVAQIP